MPDKLTLTIGIPAHNEEGNIANLLNQLQSQTGTGFTLEKIIVYCDGCTDRTPEIVKQITDTDGRIVLVNDGLRLGKLNRLSQLFQVNTSQLVVVFDADTLPADNRVVENLVRPFTDSWVGLVGGNSRPVKPATVFGRLLNAWSDVWYEVRIRHKHGNNIYNSRGCALAIRGDLVKIFKFPEGITSDSQYLYFHIRSQGQKFILAKNAIIWYRKPDNLNDYLKQIQRAEPDKQKIKHIFGIAVAEEYRIPVRTKLTGLGTAFLKHPLTTFFGALLNLYLVRLEGRPKYMLNNTAWVTSPSTKKIIFPE